MNAPGKSEHLTQLNHTLIRLNWLECQVSFCAVLRQKSGRVAEDQPIEIGIVAQWVQVVVMLRTHPEIGLQVECFLQRLEGQVNRAESSASSCQSVVNVCRLGLAFECPFEHLLSGNILTPVELDNASIVKRVGVTWKYAFSSQARLRNREIRSSPRCYFCYL